MLTLDDVAKELQISTRSVYRLIWNKKLKSVKVGNLRRVKEEDFEAFKKELK